MTPELIAQVVAVCGFAYIASLANPQGFYAVLFAAMIFSGSPVEAGFVALVVTLLLGTLTNLIRSSK